MASLFGKLPWLRHAAPAREEGSFPRPRVRRRAILPPEALEDRTLLSTTPASLIDLSKLASVQSAQTSTLNTQKTPITVVPTAQVSATPVVSTVVAPSSSHVDALFDDADGLSISRASVSAPDTSYPDLTAFINTEEADGVRSSAVDVTTASIGGYLDLSSVVLNFSTPGTVGIQVVSGQFFAGDTHTISVSAPTGQTNGITGSYIIGSHQYELTLDQVYVNANGVFTITASDVAYDYDPTNESSQTVATVAAPQVSFPSLGGATVTAPTLTIRSDGFAIADGSATLGTLNLLNDLTVTDLSFQFAGVDDTVSTDTTAGTITLGSGGGTLFSGQANITATVSTVAGAYDLSTSSGGLTGSNLSLSFANDVTLSAASAIFSANATSQIFSIDTTGSTMTVGSNTWLTGNFHVESSATPVTAALVGANGANPATYNALTIGGTNVNAFYGNGGPYWNTDGTTSSNGARGLAFERRELRAGPPVADERRHDHRLRPPIDRRQRHSGLPDE